MTNERIEADPGSFRDPSGQVFYSKGRVFRTLNEEATARFKSIINGTGFSDLVARGLILQATEINDDQLFDEVGTSTGRTPTAILEHPKLPFISYPYEWPFELLKRAALLHLDLHLAALSHNLSLVDGTAYNVQFIAQKPIFIDVLSLVPYREGDYWLGYRQFCEQFLAPLLLMSKTGIPYHPWYRGALDGLSISDVNRTLPFSAKLNWATFLHIVLHAKMDKTAQDSASPSPVRKRQGPSRNGLVGILTSLRSLISSVQPKGSTETIWRQYEITTSYSSHEAEKKRAFIARFCEAVQPAMFWDLGCNSGEYSETALQTGAKYAVGFDFDHGALDAAVARATERQLNFLPLMLDATNPSPNQGWNQRERSGLAERSSADALIALAFLHHLVVGKNVPLIQALDWITKLAPTGIIEFVPKADPKLKHMLASREDIFANYDVENMRACLGNIATIVEEQQVSSTGRVLFWYRRPL